MRATLEANVVTAMRPFAAPIRSCSVRATSRSEGERPSRTALVKSPISARQPSSPSALSFASSVGGPITGVGSSFQSPVCSTLPSGVRMISAFNSGIECTKVDQLDVELAQRETRPPRHDLHRHIERAGLTLAFRREERSGERCCVDRAAQPRPQIEQRAEMVLVGMGEHKAEQVAPLRDQERDIRHDQVDAGQFLARERHTEVDRDPFAACCPPHMPSRAEFIPISPTPPSGANTSSRAIRRALARG